MLGVPFIHVKVYFRYYCVVKLQEILILTVSSGDYPHIQKLKEQIG